LHVVPTIGHLRLAQLNGPTLEDWRDRLLTGSLVRAPLPRSLARKVLGAMKSILGEAVRGGLVAHNAAAPVKIERKQREQKKLEVGVDIPGKGDIQKLLAACTGRHRALIVTAIFTGMRASELRGLPWSAVNFENNTITVRQRADERGVIGPPKSQAGYRTIPMVDIVANTLRAWQPLCPASLGGLDLVFPTERGGIRPHTNLVARIWNPLQRKAGLIDVNGRAKFHFHSARHFFASWAIERFPPKRAQVLLGHSSIQMTFDVYGHLLKDGDDDQAKLGAGVAALLDAA